MTPKSRKTILSELRGLGGVRPTLDDVVPDVWHFGLLSRGARDPREDRSVVLVSTTVVEQGLETALMTKFSGLKDGEDGYVFTEDGASLKEFGAKIRLAYALGVIGPNAKSDLDVIRNIRNTFAHSRNELTFETPEVKAATSLLTLNERWPSMMRSIDDARETFIQTAFQYGLYLMTVGKPPLDRDENKLRNRVLN